VKEREFLKDLGIDGRTILKWFLKKWGEGHVLNGCSSGWRQLVGSCECVNKSAGKIGIVWRKILW
jgi:hypothetical protein